MENEPVKSEGQIDVELFCGDCTGQLQKLEIPRSTDRLFTLVLYKNFILRCNVCQKTTKQFCEKLKQ